MSAARIGYLGLGSNLPERCTHLAQAVTLLAARPELKLTRLSGVYESPAWGYSSAHAYLNQVLEIEWAGEAPALLATCRAVEASCGRQRAAQEALWQLAPAGTAPRYLDRTLDIDLLWLAGVELATPQLILPHPQAQQRAFVLVPWCELTPELELQGKTLRDWLALLPPPEVASVKRYAEPAGAAG